jgi:hypothetical protein
MMVARNRNVCISLIVVVEDFNIGNYSSYIS